MHEKGEPNEIVTADEWADARAPLQRREDAFLSEHASLDDARQDLARTPFDGHYIWLSAIGGGVARV